MKSCKTCEYWDIDAARNKAGAVVFPARCRHKAEVDLSKFSEAQMSSHGTHDAVRLFEKYDGRVMERNDGATCRVYEKRGL